MISKFLLGYIPTNLLFKSTFDVVENRTLKQSNHSSNFKYQLEDAKNQAKLAQRYLAEKKRLEKLEKGKVPPSEIFKTQEYSKWDSDVLFAFLTIGSSNTRQRWRGSCQKS